MKINPKNQISFQGKLEFARLRYKSPIITRQDAKPFLIPVETADDFIMDIPNASKSKLQNSINKLKNLINDYDINLLFTREGGPHSCTFYLHQSVPEEGVSKVFYYLPLKGTLKKVNSVKIVGDILTKNHKLILP